MDEYRRRLGLIKLRLRQIALRRQLVLYLKKRRMAKAALRPGFDLFARNQAKAVLAIQRFIRRYVVSKR